MNQINNSCRIYNRFCIGWTADRGNAAAISRMSIPTEMLPYVHSRVHVSERRDQPDQARRPYLWHRFADHFQNHRVSF